MIDSLNNKKIKEFEKLKKKKYRDELGLFIVETANIIEEARKANLLCETFSLNGYNYENDNIVSGNVMKKISDLDSCEVVGVCKKLDYKNIVGDKILLLDEVQDPGNLGTIIRSALAFNVTTVILGDNCCDLYNQKVLRATEGAIMHLPIIKMNIKEAIGLLEEVQIPVYSTNVVKGVEIKNIDKDKYALIVGNEGNGVKKEYQDLAKCNIYIPMNSKAESLNVAVATSIILYEFNR